MHAFMLTAVVCECGGKSQNYKVQQSHLLIAKVGFRGFLYVCSDMRARLGIKEVFWEPHASANFTEKTFQKTFT